MQPNTCSSVNSPGKSVWSVQTVFLRWIVPLYCSNTVKYVLPCRYYILNGRIDTGSSSSFSSIHLSLSPETCRVACGTWCCGANASPWYEMAELGVNESKQSFPMRYKYKENVNSAKSFSHSTNYYGICKHMPDGALSL